MKKLIFTVFCTCALSWTSEAQLIQFGIKGGGNFSNFTGGDIEGVDFKNITNYHFGAVVELGLFDNFSIQPEILYITQGAELNGFGEQVKNELGYIAIPVLAKFYLTENALSLEVGPQVSFLVNERNQFNTNDTNTFDFALAGGLGYKLTKNFFVQARYAMGLTEVKKDADIKNSVVQFSVGFMF